jgi:hypothetical protein
MPEPTEALRPTEITYINYLPLNKASHYRTPEPSSNQNLLPEHSVSNKKTSFNSRFQNVQNPFQT